jgi:hypothetical protein
VATARAAAPIRVRGFVRFISRTYGVARSGG